MSDPGPRDRRTDGAGLSAFQDLEAHARRLQLSILALVALIAILPPLLVSTVEIRALRSRAKTHAGHIAMILELYRRMPEAKAEGLQRHLNSEVERDGLSTVELIGARGDLLVRLGEPLGFWRVGTVEEVLPAGDAPFAKVRVRLADPQISRDISRMIVVHVFVGLVIGLGIYRIPVRAFARAIRELKAAQAQLIHADRLSALGSVHASLAHEVNNPLGILSARVKLTLATASERHLDVETVRDLEVIERQAARIAQIMRSLLAFARKPEFVRVPVDLNSVVSEVAGLVEEPFAKQGVKVQLNLMPQLPMIEGSPDHLQQVLLNLLTNARDAMPRGGEIHLNTARSNGHVLAEVRDSGGGLSPEALEHLFEPFFTTKGVGKGTGLGLSVSYGVARALGGNLEGFNAPEGGAVFRLSVPARRGADPNGPA
jgi:C4-dicarboxylate-specific signal transduction histidine kinase